ncbi:MAG: tRNA preQ1(34) S-adenosylmethionine ribosyltransferase-isomerase QueA [Pseudomonadota bacterium]
MDLSDFDFDLPDERIALRPARPRDSARMLVVQGDQGEGFEDARITDLAAFLRPGDVLVLNDTKVLPAALQGERRRGDAVARIFVNLIERFDASTWGALARPLKRLAVGDRIDFSKPDGSLTAEVVNITGERGLELSFDRAGPDLDTALELVGSMPLPPYIATRRAPDASDIDDYQTIYASRPGAVAAPTAGLHLTPAVFGHLSERGIGRETVTLHVGAGTFLPVKTENVEDHVMHGESGELNTATADRLNKTRRAGGRIVAVGTTAMRLLESAARDNGTIEPFRGETRLFITPGYRFKAVDILMTNFHLPRSTLFMLVCAFCGTERMKAAYGHAVREGYRFYSYGDSSLLMPAERSS